MLDNSNQTNQERSTTPHVEKLKEKWAENYAV